MAFLAPLFFIGLVALVVPVVIHMIQRERKEFVEFPSLMFVRKIPYRSFRRQRIRHWVLLLIRCAALLLLILAFARPFLNQSSLANSGSGAREVVVLLDRSYSMGYEDNWDRAKEAALNVVDELASDDRATLILFDSGAQVGPRSMVDRNRLRGLISDSELSAGTTQYGPALKLAEGIFEDSSLPRLEAILISDFQEMGLESATGIHFPEGAVLTPIFIGSDRSPNISVVGILFEREYFSGRERVAVSARITNRHDQPVSELNVSLEIDGREIESVDVGLQGNGSETVDFSAITMGDVPMAGRVRIEPDALPVDDSFYFVMSPGQVVRVLLVKNNRALPDSALHLRRALDIGSSPAFEVLETDLASLTVSKLSDRNVVILDDIPAPSIEVLQALQRFVERGGGLLVVSGERSNWGVSSSGLLSGTLNPPIDRSGRGGAIGFADYSHPIFELFGSPRSGDVTTARFFRYRPFEPNESSVVLARYDDGNPALAEHNLGDGKVLLWMSTLDNFWNDLALKPIYLPFVHRMTQYLASYKPSPGWYESGQVVNFIEQQGLSVMTNLNDRELVVVSPTGRRVSLSEGDRAGFIALQEQGFYEIRDASANSGVQQNLAVNVDLAEADLTTVDVDEFMGTITGRVSSAPSESTNPSRTISAVDIERRQDLWWYLLVIAVVLFILETVMSNRLSRKTLDLG